MSLRRGKPSGVVTFDILNKTNVNNSRPSIGDFVVTGGTEGYTIERREPGDNWYQVSINKHRLAALQDARTFAKSAGTRAWTYELDNQYLELTI